MSNNLALSQVAAHQDQAEVTINDQASQLDGAVTDGITIPVDNTNAYTLSSTELRRFATFVFEDDGTPPSATVTITVPGSIERGMFVVRNDFSTEDLEVEISGQSEPAVTMAPGDAFVLHSDGVNVRTVGGGGGGTDPLDISSFFAGLPGNLELIVRYMAARAITMPINLTGSYGTLGVAPTALTTFDIRKNGSSIGTMNFAIATTTATFTFASQQTLAAGDRLDIVNQAVADATAADLSFTLACTR